MISNDNSIPLPSPLSGEGRGESEQQQNKLFISSLVKSLADFSSIVLEKIRCAQQVSPLPGGEGQGEGECQNILHFPALRLTLRSPLNVQGFPIFHLPLLVAPRSPLLAVPFVSIGVHPWLKNALFVLKSGMNYFPSRFRASVSSAMPTHPHPNQSPWRL